jgi:thiol-disulfide isomerase/thioredoxin
VRRHVGRARRERPGAGRHQTRACEGRLGAGGRRADGTTFSLADVPGKAKVVNVWATWCAPCIGEMPILNSVAKAYASKDVTFVAVSVDENGPADVDPVLKRGRVKIDFRLAYATFDELKAIDVAPPIPDTLVFDASNRLVKHFDKVVEREELEAAIGEALGGGGK